MFFKYTKGDNCDFHVDNPELAIRDLRERLNPTEGLEKHARSLIEEAVGSWTTHWYDSYQFYVTGVF